jgi:hypothetical protein
MEAIDQRHSLGIVMAELVQACPGHPRLFSQHALKKDVDAQDT